MKQAILCLDDEEQILDTLQRQLRNLLGKCFIFEKATQPADAFEILEELDAEGVQVLAVISDWLMPEMRGDVFLTQVHARYPDAVKILLTGQADPVAVSQLLNQKFCSFVAKPWKSEELTSILAPVMNHSN